MGGRAGRITSNKAKRKEVMSEEDEWRRNENK
jgi:hypothetical protein